MAEAAPGGGAAAQGTAPRVAAAAQGTAPRVVVAGGGITGLAAAWELAGAGARVTVVEAAPEVGGKLRAETVAGRAVDVGPDAFLARRPEARELCDALGLAGELVAPGASGAQVWARGRLRPLPEGLVLGVPTRLAALARSGVVGPAGVARAAADLLARRAPAHRAPAEDPDRPDGDGADRSVGELVGPRLGRAVVEQLVDPLVGGIHAGPVAAMSAAAVFPALLQAAGTPGSLMRALRAAAPPVPAGPGGPPVFLAPRHGMARLARALGDALVARGVELRTGTVVTGLAPAGDGGPGWRLSTSAGPVDADGVVVCLPAAQAAEAVGTGPDEQGRLGRLLGGVDTAGVVVATFAFRPGGPAERWRRAPGTGFLVPVAQGLLTTGCTWLSAKWPETYEGGPVLVRLSAGRDGDRRALSLDDGTLVRRLLGELRALAGDVDDPLDVQVTRWSAAFPQYRVGHLAWARDVAAAAAALPGVAVAGAAFEGVGVPACIGSGRRAARRVLAHLVPTT